MVKTTVRITLKNLLCEKAKNNVCTIKKGILIEINCVYVCCYENKQVWDVDGSTN